MGGSSPASYRWGCSEQWVAALLPATGGAAQSNGWQLSCQLQVGLLRAMGGSSPASYRWGCSEQWVAALLPATGGAAQSNGWQLSCQLQVGLLRVLWCGGFDTAMATTAVSLSSSTALTPHPSPPHSPLTPHQCTYPSPLCSAASHSCLCLL